MNNRDVVFMQGARELGWTDSRSIVSLLYAIDKVRTEFGEEGGGALLFGLKMALGVMFDFKGETIGLEDQLWKLSEEAIGEE